MQGKSLLEPIPQKKDDINQLPVFQLKERLARQEKLLLNLSFVARLPDKGARIHKHVADLRAALDSQQLLDDATRHLEAMSLEARATSASGDPRPMLTQPTERRARHEIVDRSSTEEARTSQAAVERHTVATGAVQRHAVATDGESGGAREAPTEPATGPVSQKRRPAKDIAAVRERVAQMTSTRSKALSLEESSELLQGQEKRLKELQRKHAEERLRKLVGKHDVGQLPSTPEFQRHRGAVPVAAQTLGDRQQQRMTSLQQSFAGDVDNDDDNDDAEGDIDNVEDVDDDDDLDSVD